MDLPGSRREKRRRQEGEVADPFGAPDRRRADRPIGRAGARARRPESVPAIVQNQKPFGKSFAPFARRRSSSALLERGDDREGLFAQASDSVRRVGKIARVTSSHIARARFCPRVDAHETRGQRRARLRACGGRVFAPFAHPTAADFLLRVRSGGDDRDRAASHVRFIGRHRAKSA